MSLLYRIARADELERAQALVVASINDLTERHGFGAIASLRPAHFQMFSLQDDPGGLWVAEDGGEMLGFAFSWVRGDLWFLAELFVAPGQQGRGIGNELIARTLQHGASAGASTKALITFSFNTVSQGLYIRHGLFPRLPIANFSIAREALAARRPIAQLRCTPIENTASHLLGLAEIDAAVLGVFRDKHHQHLLSDGAVAGVFLHAGDERIGYAYVAPNGHIGPLAVIRPDAVAAAFQTALALAAERDSAQVSAFIPGASEMALQVAVKHGMRITFPMVLMSSRDFGDWARYLPRNPGFM